ncbi:MAG: Eco57I restriction-modification methylase domain-containing protein [Candidatus Borkfalkiaceae bacterium]|nr:Eco57I restriction-modification methylase domain-containing protein [Christensenellaceae bacterium]
MITINEAEEILKKEYHIDNFLYLVDDILLPDFKNDKHEVVFKNDIFVNVTQLGTSRICEVTVFEVILKAGVDKRRVTITQEMFRILRGQGINNAVVAFANADKNNYRISLLTSKYEFDGDKIVKVISNPRRYSYTLGYGTKTKTAYKFLIEKGKVNSLEELTARFSVEVVNKQFYSEIATCFTELVGGDRDGRYYEKQLNLYGITNHNKYSEFAVRLIGRIVFCWFLKEKKSENGIPLLPESIMSVSGITDNYYHTVLEPLFFELLNTKINSRKGKYLEDGFYKQIPYLNGGLFSPHNDDLYKYDRINQCGTFGLVTIPDDWFRHFYGVLNQYNFTVDENTSYDIELSIDPEMLGRIFENLLAEINPETGENAKKSTGSFYTPRDIVDYMVDNSILEYLKTKTAIDEIRLKALISYSKEDDELASFTDKENKEIIDALYTVTVLDPACGSGAFPIGVLQKIVYILQQIDPQANLWFDKATENVSILLKKEFEKKFNAGSLDYIRKLSVIQNSIFGVDIQPIAVEIARLRCFLSLVIEEKVYDDEPNRGINPLPNLDFKFVIANSLIHLPDESDINKKVSNNQMSIFEKQDHIDQLKEVREEYFTANDSETKTELKLAFSEVQKLMFQTALDNAKMASARYQALFQWKPFSNETTPWFDPEWMFGIKDGFDIVIGNPPYLDSENMVNSGLSDLREYISCTYKYCKGNWDIYIAFFERAFNLLVEHGILVFITPDKWLSRPFGEKLRINLLSNIKNIYQSGREIFDSALVDSIVTMMTKNKNEFLEVRKDSQKGEMITRFISKNYFNEVTNLDIIFSDYIDIIQKIETNSFSLQSIAKCENACATSDCYKLKEYIYEKENYDDVLPTEFKIINTGTVGRFAPRWGHQEMRYLKDKYLYPVVAKNQFLFEFNNSYSEKSKKVKIIIKGLTLLDACLDFDGSIIPGKSTLMIPADLETLYLLLGVINSKLALFYIQEKYASSSYNGGINFNKDMINNFPIKNDHLEEFKKIRELSREIVEIKTNDYNTNTVNLENEIDNIIYDIYDLTAKEIAIVEQSVK